MKPDIVVCRFRTPGQVAAFSSSPSQAYGKQLSSFRMGSALGCDADVDCGGYVQYSVICSGNVL